MSLTITTDVVCDICGRWMHGVTDGRRTRGKDARYKARRLGWAFRDRQDLCPDCAVACDLRQKP